MKLQPHYLCPHGHRTRNRRGKLGPRKGDVKACYVRIRRRWLRVGTLCLHCRQFTPEL
jgi:hypothetical protein